MIELKSAATLLVLASLSISIVHADEPTGMLTLACKGTENFKGDAGTSSDQINVGVILDFQKKTVTGLSDSLLRIIGLTETIVSFNGAEPGWVMNGTLDRVTGFLVAASMKSDPKSRKTILSLSYELQCRVTQRMF
jgi:hypothetical protein